MTYYRLTEPAFNDSLQEVSQFIPIKFSLAFIKKKPVGLNAGDLEQVIPWVKCTDYIKDVIAAQHGKKKFKVYGLTYAYKEEYGNPTTNFVLLIGSPDNDWNDRVQRSITNLKEFLKGKYGIIIDRIAISTVNRSGIGIPPSLFSHPSLIHLITFLIRAGTYTRYSTIKDLVGVVSKINSGDGDIAAHINHKSALEAIDRLLNNSHLFSDMRYMNISEHDPDEFHNTTGIRSFCNRVVDYGYSTDMLGINLLKEATSNDKAKK